MYLGSKDYKIFLYISVSVSLKNSRSWVISLLVRRYFLGLRAFKLLSLNLRRTVWTVAVTLSPLLSWVAVIKGFLAPSFRLPFKVKSIHIHFCRTLQKTLNFHIFFFFDISLSFYVNVCYTLFTRKQLILLSQNLVRPCFLSIPLYIAISLLR